MRLAVLIDRGHREVPVKPNYVGKNIPSSEKDRVRVKLRGLEQEEHDQAVIFSVLAQRERHEVARPPAPKKGGAINYERDFGIGGRKILRRRGLWR